MRKTSRMQNVERYQESEIRKTEPVPEASRKMPARMCLPSGHGRERPAIATPARRRLSPRGGVAPADSPEQPEDDSPDAHRLQTIPLHSRVAAAVPAGHYRDP